MCNPFSPFRASNHTVAKGKNSRAHRQILIYPIIFFICVLIIAATLFLSQLIRIPPLKVTSGLKTPQSSPCVGVNEIHQLDPGIAYICDKHMYKTQKMVKISGPYTMTLETTYADRNRIMVSCTIGTSRVNLPFASITTMLSTDRNVKLKNIGNGIKQKPGQKGTISIVSFFDASSIVTEKQEINLHLFLHIGGNKTVTQTVIPIGTTMFAFSTPFFLGTTLNLKQTNSVQSVPLTLEQVVITPSETRLSILGKILTLDQISKRDSTEPFTLSTSTWTSIKKKVQAKLMYSSHPFAVQGIILTFPYALSELNGTWIFHVAPFGVVNKNGNWYFHFTVSKRGE